MRTEQRACTGAGGVGLATKRWMHGTEGPSLLAVHGTGFCKELWDPVFGELAAQLDAFDAIAFDQRAHGDSDPVPPPYDWWDMGRDVIGVLDGAQGVTGVGHSSGGTALVFAELLAPGSFASLVLIEPITFPGPYVRPPDLPVARAARSRRRHFPTREAAADNWRGKGPFASWDARVLDAYVRCGLREAEDGFTLKCPPEWEAEFYMAATVHGGFDRLGELSLPVLIVSGERSQSHPQATMESIAASVPDARLEVIPDLTHFLPMESPSVMAGLVAGMIGEETAMGRR